MHKHDHPKESPVGSRKIEVYSKRTGRKQIIPEAWLDHPILGADFQRTPSRRAAGIRRGEFVVRAHDAETAQERETPEISVAEAADPVEQAGSKPETNDTPEHGDEE